MIHEARRILADNPQVLVRELAGLSLVCATILAVFSLPLLA